MIASNIVKISRGLKLKKSRFFRSPLSRTAHSAPATEKKKVSTPPYPWLMVPIKEARNNPEAHTFWTNYCFYNVWKQEFNTTGPKHIRDWGSQFKCVESSHGWKTIFDEHRKECVPNNSKCVGSSHGWLAFLDPIDLTVYLSNPFINPNIPSNLMTRSTVSLPSIQTLSDFYSFSQNKKLQYYRYYKDAGMLENARSDDEEEYCTDSFNRLLSECFVEKMALSSAPSLKCPEEEGEEDCTVLMSILSPDVKLAFCRTGDVIWMDLDSDCSFDDIVHRKKDGLFYGLTDSDDLEIVSWDLSYPFSPVTYRFRPTVNLPTLNLYEHSIRKECSRRNYLVESPSGRLLMVMRHFAWHVAGDGIILKPEDDKDMKLPYRTLRFDVFEVDLVKKRINYVEKLGDEALFLGMNDSFALPASECPGIEPNSIYFSDHPFKKGRFGKYVGHDFGVYDCSTYKRVGRCYNTPSKKFVPPPIWIAPS